MSRSIHAHYARIGKVSGTKFWFHGLRNVFITAADRELMLPRLLTKRLVNHARPSNVTEGYAADWTVEQLRDPRSESPTGSMSWVRSRRERRLERALTSKTVIEGFDRLAVYVEAADEVVGRRLSNKPARACSIALLITYEPHVPAFELAPNRNPDVSRGLLQSLRVGSTTDTRSKGSRSPASPGNMRFVRNQDRPCGRDIHDSVLTPC